MLRGERGEMAATRRAHKATMAVPQSLDGLKLSGGVLIAPHHLAKGSEGLGSGA